ncbi:MAG: hybrid sensor histidine kinase/response regulator, partial [Sphingobacteriales bacterium]
GQVGKRWGSIGSPIYPNKQKDTRSFLGKLFGAKKKQPQNDEAYKIVSEETNIQRDTVAQAIKDSILHSMTEAMQKIEKNQRRKSAQFINRETTLTRANNELIGQILTILKQVENEAVAQIEVNNGHAKYVVNASVKRISLIMLAFFLVTVILLYFILTDISRSNTYRNQLEQARDAAEYHSMAKQRFLSNMSHEIRTPLQSIIGYAELISQQEHPRKKDIEAIYQSSGHLMQIVNEVLDYNRIISGKFTFTNRVFNITALLDEVVSVMSLQAAKKSLKMVTNYSPTANIQVEGDPFRLKQVLYNLLGNAIKFTHAGQITLTASCLKQDDNAYFTFSIKDTGIGLTEADTGKIFNEFEQVDNADRNSQTGTGLGLTISKELIESQGGNIYVESKPGKGSTFTFRLQFTIATDVGDEISDTIEALLIKDTNTWIVDDDSFILE